MCAQHDHNLFRESPIGCDILGLLRVIHPLDNIIKKAYYILNKIIKRYINSVKRRVGLKTDLQRVIEGESMAVMIRLKWDSENIK